MAAKAEAKPTIQGQRLKTRKRDEKVKFDPTQFRDTVLEQLNSRENVDAAATYLETAANDLDLRRYSDEFFDILIAGGILAPGGTLADEDVPLNRFSVFAMDNSDESIKSMTQLFNRVLRRYKYMLVLLEDHLQKLLKFLKAFSSEEREKLAKFVAAIMSAGLSSAKPLNSACIESLVKDGMAEEFITNVMRFWIKETSINSLATAFRKANIDLMNILPANKRSYENLVALLKEKGDLEEVLSWLESQRTSGVKKDLQAALVAAMSEEEVVDNEALIKQVAEAMSSQGMRETEVVSLVWAAVMAAVDWNKKADLAAEQALRQVNTYAKLLAAFTAAEKAQLLLLNRIQGYCYENQTLMKVFSKIVMLLYQREVLSEVVVLEWFNSSHSDKGQSVFLAQMDDMVKWLQTAEEEAE